MNAIISDVPRSVNNLITLFEMFLSYSYYFSWHNLREGNRTFRLVLKFVYRVLVCYEVAKHTFFSVASPFSKLYIFFFLFYTLLPPKLSVKWHIPMFCSSNKDVLCEFIYMDIKFTLLSKRSADHK